MYEHVGEQVHVLHAVNGSHAPAVLTILHTCSYDEEEMDVKGKTCIRRLGAL